MKSVHPATGEVLRTYDLHDEDAVEEAVAAAAAAQDAWRRRGFEERARILMAVADGLEAGKDEYARLMVEEMGKPIREAEGEVDKCAWVCRHYAEHAAAFLRDEPIDSDAERSWVAYRPLGVVLAVMPWNFPFWQVFRFGAPALMAGNGVLLKHAPNVPGCALAIERLFADAGLPQGLFRALLVEEETVSALLEDARVAAATLTGSVAAGKAVAAQAGAQVKKTVLELGGSDPYLVLEDADLESAVETCAKSRLINGGQSCIAAKRFVVVAPVAARFEELLVERFRAVKQGDPFDRDMEIGPMARPDLRDTLHRQVRESVEAGARCLLGGEVPDGPGCFYPPTVLTDVRAGMPAYDEELFGPVAAVLRVEDEDEAVRVANDSRYGLGAAVFTADRARGERLAADALEAGCVFVNDFVRSDPRLPFGGIKESGYGRELGVHGIREFVQAKTIAVS